MRFSLFLFSVLLLSLTGCGVPFDDFEVASENVHNETEPNDEDTQAEQFGITLDGSTWHEIRGAFDTASDEDYFRIELGSQTTIDLVTWREFQNEEQQYNLVFPININEYAEDGTLGTQNFLAASGWGVDVEEDASYVMLKVYGQTEEDAEVDSYRDGRPYRVQLR